MSPSGDSHRIQYLSPAKQARENTKYSWCALVLSLKAQSVTWNLSRLSGFKHRNKAEQGGKAFWGILRCTSLACFRSVYVGFLWQAVKEKNNVTLESW